MIGLLIILLLVAIMQPSDGRRAACCLFACYTIAFDLFCTQLPGASYYLAAAVSDSLCIILLNGIRGDDRIVVGLQTFCLVSIVFNFAGWIAYEMYTPAWPYNWAFYSLYFSVILFIIYPKGTQCLNYNSPACSWVSV